MLLFWFSLAVVIGIGLSSIFTISSQFLWGSLLVCIGSGFYEIRISRSRHHPLLSRPLFKIPVSFIIAGILCGMLRFLSLQPMHRQDDIFHYADSSSVTVSGIVNSDPYRTAHYTSVTIDCETISSQGQTKIVSGKLSASLPNSFQVEYGDRVALAGDLESTIEEGALPISSRYGKQKIYSKMGFPDIEILEQFQGNPILTSLYRLRKRANELIFSMIPFPESAVLSGIVLGLDTAIPDHLWNGYRASGTAHIIVISGFNISLIAYLLFKVLTRLWKYEISIPITIAVVVLFALLVGADQPVVRAAIMAVIALPAPYFGRKAIGIYNLTLAAAMMLLVNPYQLWDVSFQLSFLATLSLLTVVDPVVNWITEKVNSNQEEENKDRFRWLIELVVSTLSASFVVFPILFKMTGTISLASLPANLIIVPLQPFIMVMGSMAAVIGSVSPILGGVFAKIAWPFMFLCNQVALRFSAHPSATRFLPGWFYWISLAGVIILLSISSVTQIIRLSKPHTDVE